MTILRYVYVILDTKLSESRLSAFWRCLFFFLVLVTHTITLQPKYIELYVAENNLWKKETFCVCWLNKPTIIFIQLETNF